MGLTAGKEQHVNGEHCCLPAETGRMLLLQTLKTLMSSLVGPLNQTLRLLAAVPRKPISLDAERWGFLGVVVKQVGLNHQQSGVEQ